MKKIIPILAFTLMALGANAQNCFDIVLPFFGYDTVQLEAYPEWKMLQRCSFSQASFYESDTIPAGAYVYNIEDVREAYGTNHLPQSYVVYAYNFHQFQVRYPTGDVTLCFATPSSTHPYLVLRSIEEAMHLASQIEEEYYR